MNYHIIQLNIDSVQLPYSSVSWTAIALKVNVDVIYYNSPYIEQSKPYDLSVSLIRKVDGCLSHSSYNMHLNSCVNISLPCLMSLT